MSFAITAVTLAAIVMATPILQHISAKLRLDFGIPRNENPQLSQDSTWPLLIFRQLGHCFDIVHPPPVGGLL